MAIDFSPKVGRVLECDYGCFTLMPNGKIDCNPDYHLPPEMVKKRLVVVLNGKFDGKSSIVVPLSQSRDESKIAKEMHILIPNTTISEASWYPKNDECRWVKADLIQQVSHERLYKLRTKRGHEPIVLPSHLVTEIQKAVIRAINAKELLNYKK